MRGLTAEPGSLTTFAARGSQVAAWKEMGSIRPEATCSVVEGRIEHIDAEGLDLAAAQCDGTNVAAKSGAATSSMT